MSAMRCSLFGKLAAKRDFIAVLAPAEFLKVWEPWMQSGLSASRQSLGEAWQTAFLTAPIWRFWLGAEICGATVLGAFMPSVDGMGRYYPLTLFAHAGGSGTAIPPPDIEPQDDWFATAEEFLLSTLDTEVAYDSTIRALEQLSPPNSHALHECPDGMSPVGDDTIMAEIGDQSFSDVFASLRAANHAGTYAVASFWWTLGGGGFQAIGLCCRRMPDPSLQAGMMTGRFSPAMD